MLRQILFYLYRVSPLPSFPLIVAESVNQLACR